MTHHPVAVRDSVSLVEQLQWHPTPSQFEEGRFHRMENNCNLIELPGGRRLAYGEFGDPHGAPVLYCHGFPSSRREALLVHDAALAERARILAPDRPGYGDSEFQPDRTIPHWAADVAALADQLGIGRLAVLGTSGGGPYALACAAHIPERVTACSLVCPLGPIYLEDVLEEMNWAARMHLGLTQRAPFLSELLFGPVTLGFFAHWPETVEHLRTVTVPDVDRQELRGMETRRILNQTIQDAMRNGARGARQDVVLYTRDWGIPFETIDLDLDLWHGEADATVPVSHTRWYEAHLPHGRAHYLPGEGHFSLPLRYARDILRALLAPAGEAGASAN